MQSGTLSVCEYIDSCIGRIEELELRVGAWASLDYDLVRRRAVELDQKLRRNWGSTGALFGLPVGVKDVFNTSDFPTEMGSPIWRGFRPGNDARAVSELLQHDALVMGKTVTAEFAVHHPGSTVNPHDHQRSPGTSSSGSAVAVACEMVPLALGTQTAGSTIRPASFNGVYGFKPTFGLIPRTGILKTLDTLDHVTCFSRTPEDLRLALDAMRVRGRNYPQVNRFIDSAPPVAEQEKWKVGFLRTHVWDQAARYVRDAMEAFVVRLAREPWIELVEIDTPGDLASAHDVHETIYTKSLSYYFDEEYCNHREQISPVMQELIERGRTISTEAFRAGLRMQNVLATQADEALRKFDVLICHSTAHIAPIGLATREANDPCLMWTLCRVPALSVPAFVGPERMPFGLQIVASPICRLSSTCVC
jgi:Asp-tRNA(Asn)/Glu-tRNA(Gln) amidotransferase A subunit family amidase